MTIQRATKSAFGMLALVASVLFTACSSSNDTAPEEAGTPCAPTSTRTCVGAERCMGVQSCTSGRTWGPCECRVPAADAAADARAVDAAADALAVDAAADARRPGPPLDSAVAEDAGQDSGPEPDTTPDMVDASPLDAGSAADTAPEAAVTVPLTCVAADDGIGCCAGEVLYYCTSAEKSPTSRKCAVGEVCGWSAKDKYYDCVAPPGGPDPSGIYPLACK